MMAVGYDYPIRSYKAEKNEKFNQYKEKARQLRNRIDETSLKDSDKKKLKAAVAEIITGV